MTALYSKEDSNVLGFTLFLAGVMHVFVLAFVGFVMPNSPEDVTRSMEITLASHSSDKMVTPDQADYAAQYNQQGSGSLDEKAAPKTIDTAPFHSDTFNPLTLASSPMPTSASIQPKKIISTQSSSQYKVLNAQAEQEDVPETDAQPVFDETKLSSEIASLEAQLAEDVQAYAKRPRIHRLNAASTMRDRGAWYKEEWRKKIERIGNMNYPEEARINRMYGQLRLMVSINRDGSLQEVILLESSGMTVLDQAAINIVRISSPYAAFSGDLSDFDRLEIIRTWQFERGDRLSSQ